MGAEIFAALRKQLRDAGFNTNVGDEGGFAPGLKSADEALAFMTHACERAGYRPGEDVTFAIDCAASEFYVDGKYVLAGEGLTLDAVGMVAYLEDLVGRYPIVSIEDACAEDDWDGWEAAHRHARRPHPVGRRRPVVRSPTSSAWRAASRGQGITTRHPGEGQPDRHPVGDVGDGG